MRVINSLVYSFVYIAIYLATQITVSTVKAFGLSGAIGLLISYIFTILVCSVLADKKLNLPAGFSGKGITLKSIISAILLTAALMGIAFVCTSVDIFAPFMADYTPGPGDIDGSKTMIFIIFCFAAPIFEELLFRGLIFGELSKAMPVFLANIIQALLFALMHANVIQGVYTFILAFMLGMVLYKTRCIYIPIIMHIVFNMLSSFAGVYFSVPGIIIIAPASAVLLIAGILLLPSLNNQH